MPLFANSRTIGIICFGVISGKLSWLTSRSLSELDRAHVSPPTTKDKLRADQAGSLNQGRQTAGRAGLSTAVKSGSLLGYCYTRGHSFLKRVGSTSQQGRTLLSSGSVSSKLTDISCTLRGARGETRVGATLGESWAWLAGESVHRVTVSCL